MLQTKKRENTNPNPNPNPNPSLLALKPRQVMLAEQSTNKKKTMTKNDHHKTLILKPQQKALLLHSVLRYLDNNSFSKALKRLLSEAQIEDDSWKTCSVDLEDMYCKYLETRGQEDINSNTYKEQELLKDAITKKDDDDKCAADEKSIIKKRKKKSDESDTNAAADLSGALKKHADDAVCEVQMDESSTKHKGSKKKKSTLVSGSIEGDVRQDIVDSLPGGEMDLVSSKGDTKIDSESKVKSKEKKKKNKLDVNSHAENVGEPRLEDKKEAMAAKIVDDSALAKIPDIPLEGKKVKTKDRKRKKEGSVTEELPQELEKVVDKENPIINDSTTECFQTPEEAANKEMKSSKKRKRLASNKNEQQLLVEVATEDSKRRKTKVLEVVKSNEQIKKVNSTPGGDGLAGEESKMENGKVAHDDLKQVTKQLDKHANGKLEKNGEKKSTLQNSTRKELNGSAEPKTVNAFQRVKVDEVQFADDRLQNNSYWAKDGAEVGYGAKAQEVLGQVRGRDFRHEKTKKKRGSYRGGQIDMESHSIKFHYSDDDDE